jgi:hypothetical protein
MKTALQAAAVLALLAFAAGTAVLSLDAHRFLRDGDDMVLHADTATTLFSASIAGKKREVDAVLKNLGETVNSAQQAATEQRAYWQKTSADSDKTVKALRVVVDRAGLLMKHTDEQLNSSFFPDLDRNLTLTSESAQLAMASFSHAGEALEFQLNDIDAPRLVAHMDETALHLDAAALSLEHSAQSGEHVAKFYEDKLTKPASLAKQIGLGAVDLAAKFGSMFAGFAK